MKKALLPLLFSPILAAATPTISSSIYPLQQIANAISGTKTNLIAASYLSPHTYAITPSKAQQLLDADIFLWVGPAMMPQLDSYVDKRIDSGKTTITAAILPDIHLIQGTHTHDHHDASSSPHDHDKHDHDKHDHDKHDHDKHDHDKHDHDKHDHDKHDHDKHDHDKHDHDKHAHEANLNYDPHVWLAPHNAKIIAKAVADALIQHDSKNRQQYLNNLATFNNDVTEAEHNILGLFESQRPLPYFVFHDAYHYFEDTFGVKHEAVITAHAGQAVRPKNIIAIKAQLKQHTTACLFREPQFNTPIINQLGKDKNILISELDPVGYQKKDSGYPAILLNIANKLVNCR